MQEETMTEEELAAFGTWLRLTQGVELEPAALRQPAGAAAALGALVGEAAAALPFGAEPSGFDAAIANMTDAKTAEKGDDDAG
jgi:hypothetical protein